MMKIKKKANSLFAILAVATLTLPVSAGAANVYLVAPSTDLYLGETYEIELWTNDFGAASMSMGGGVDAFYDNAVLDFVSWTDTSGSLIPSSPTDLVGEVNGISVDTGVMDWLPAAATQSGILEFTVLESAALGATSITLAVNDQPVGGFYAMAPITYDGVDLNILDTAVVPVPAAIWLFASALGFLLSARAQRALSAAAL